MQLVILAAGKGTRMMPLTQEVPKPMVAIKGKPKLQYTLESLPEKINQVLVVINYLGNQIKNFFGSQFAGKELIYVQQGALNGTAGALWQAKDFLEEEFIVMMGDDFYLKSDVENVLNQKELVILLYQSREVKRFDSINLDEKGFFRGINFKKNNSFDLNQKVLLNTGLYKLNKKIFDYDMVEIGNGEYGLPQTMAVMAQDFPIKGLIAKKWLPMGFVKDINLAEMSLDDFLKGE